MIHIRQRRQVFVSRQPLSAVGKIRRTLAQRQSHRSGVRIDDADIRNAILVEVTHQNSCGIASDAINSLADKLAARVGRNRLR